MVSSSHDGEVSFWDLNSIDCYYKL